MLSKLGVGVQLVIAFIIVSLIAVVTQLVVSTRSVSRNSNESAMVLLSEVAGHYSVEVNKFLSDGMLMAKSARSTLTVSKSLDDSRGQASSREDIVAFFDGFVMDNPNILALWTVWAPDAFDGLDKEHQNRGDINDETGRFVPYVFKSQGRLVHEPLRGYDQPGDGDYNLIAFKSGKPAILEPYPYDVGGREILITSLALPIRQNNQVVATVGADISLESITEFLSTIKPMGDGTVALITPDGLISGHSDLNLVGSRYRDTRRGQIIGDEVARVQQTGQPLRQIIPNGWAEGMDAAVAVQPFLPEGTEANWAFVASVPMSTIQAGTNALMRQGILLGGVILVVAIVFGLLSVKVVVGGLTRRIMDVVRSLEVGADELHDNAQNIAASSHSISEGAQNQAAALEETSAALEEISSMTRRNSENAQTTSRNTRSTIQLMGESRAEMTTMNEAMAGIDEAAKKIAGIIKTIEDIAFQTNLLALNAAVEAARAGEAGQGFAVVAEEVRNLATRSADSAKSTAELIEETTRRIQRGSDIVGRLSEGFGSVAQGAEEINALVEQIASATGEQDAGISQVSQAMTSVDKVTQENVEAVTRLAGATNKLGHQAENINQAISQLLMTIGGSN